MAMAAVPGAVPSITLVSPIDRSDGGSSRNSWTAGDDSLELGPESHPTGPGRPAHEPHWTVQPSGPPQESSYGEQDFYRASYPPPEEVQAPWQASSAEAETEGDSTFVLTEPTPQLPSSHPSGRFDDALSSDDHHSSFTASQGPSRNLPSTIPFDDPDPNSLGDSEPSSPFPQGHDDIYDLPSQEDHEASDGVGDLVPATKGYTYHERQVYVALEAASHEHDPDPGWAPSSGSHATLSDGEQSGDSAGGARNGVAAAIWAPLNVPNKVHEIQQGDFSMRAHPAHHATRNITPQRHASQHVGLYNDDRSVSPQPYQAIAEEPYPADNPPVQDRSSHSHSLSRETNESGYLSPPSITTTDTDHQSEPVSDSRSRGFPGADGDEVKGGKRTSRISKLFGGGGASRDRSPGRSSPIDRNRDFGGSPSPAPSEGKRSSKFFKRLSGVGGGAARPDVVTASSIINSGLPPSPSPSYRSSGPSHSPPTSSASSFSPPPQHRPDLLGVSEDLSSSRRRSGSAASSIMKEYPTGLDERPDVQRTLADSRSTPTDRALALLSLDRSLSPNPDTGAARRSFEPEPVENGWDEDGWRPRDSVGSSVGSPPRGNAMGYQGPQSQDGHGDHHGRLSPVSHYRAPSPSRRVPSHSFAHNPSFRPSAQQIPLLPSPTYDPLVEPVDDVMQLASSLHNSSRGGFFPAATGKIPGGMEGADAAGGKRRSKLFGGPKHAGADPASPSAQPYDPDPRLSLSTLLFRVLAEEKHHRPAKVMLGLALRSGWGVARDEPGGLAWLKEAASEALFETQTDNQRAPAPTQARKAREGTGSQAELQLALGEIANSYAFGLGAPRDPAKALEYYEIAATLGDVDAMNALGDAWYSGALLPKGMKKSKVEAAQWYRRAERAGGRPIISNAWIWKDKYDVPSAARPGAMIGAATP